MILSLFRRSRQAGTISSLYGMIVAQARLPGFYRDYLVPDTVNGRFDLLVLHLSLVLRRLRMEAGSPGEGGPVQLSQALFDHFCEDMDGNLREMGIADLKVPKEMRHIGEAFYGRSQAYDQALEQGQTADLATAIARNIYGTDAIPDTAKRLANYAVSASAALDRQSTDAIMDGQLTFPKPDDIPYPGSA